MSNEHPSVITNDQLDTEFLAAAEAELRAVADQAARDAYLSQMAYLGALKQVDDGIAEEAAVAKAAGQPLTKRQIAAMTKERHALIDDHFVDEAARATARNVAALAALADVDARQADLADGTDELPE
jgi:hypothetical protein